MALAVVSCACPELVGMGSGAALGGVSVAVDVVVMMFLLLPQG
jgi:hypothetical protein